MFVLELKIQDFLNSTVLILYIEMLLTYWVIYLGL